jgi:hypothetical protein
VQAVRAKYDLPYTTGPLRYQYLLALRTIITLARPGPESPETSCTAVLLARTFSFRKGRHRRGALRSPGLVASRLDQPHKRLLLNYFSLPCTSVHAPAA